MGNIAGALESPRFTRLPRPSHSDAIYLPNCSSDAFITLLDWSTVFFFFLNLEIPGLAAFPLLVLYSLKIILEKTSREPSKAHQRERGRVLRELTYVGLVDEIGILDLKKQLVHAPS